MIDALALLNDRSRPLEERLAAVEWLGQIRGAYTEQESVAELRQYNDQARVSPQHQALWDLQQRAADETESEMLRLVREDHTINNTRVERRRDVRGEMCGSRGGAASRLAEAQAQWETGSCAAKEAGSSSPPLSTPSARARRQRTCRRPPSQGSRTLT